MHKGEKKIRLEMFYGMKYSTLSCFCGETRAADARAFAALAAHLREVDSRERTVIYIQVENESGIMGAAREHSDEADRLFAGEAPPEFAAYMRAHTGAMREDVRGALPGATPPAGRWRR